MKSETNQQWLARLEQQDNVNCEEYSAALRAVSNDRRSPIDLAKRYAIQFEVNAAADRRMAAIAGRA